MRVGGRGQEEKKHSLGKKRWVLLAANKMARHAPHKRLNCATGIAYYRHDYHFFATANLKTVVRPLRIAAARAHTHFSARRQHTHETAATMPDRFGFQVVILAGGECKRMYPITSGLGKALLPVANKPLLSYPLRNLAEAGIKSAIVVRFCV
jgi:hypothetical protein